MFKQCFKKSSYIIYFSQIQVLFQLNILNTKIVLFEALNVKSSLSVTSLFFMIFLLKPFAIFKVAKMPFIKNSCFFDTMLFTNLTNKYVNNEKYIFSNLKFPSIYLLSILSCFDFLCYSWEPNFGELLFCSVLRVASPLWVSMRLSLTNSYENRVHFSSLFS